MPSRLLLLLTLVPALALGATSAPVWVVGQCQGGSDKEAFVRQVAHQASIWTAKQGFEVCGRLSQDESGNWGMTLTTNYSQLACLVTDGLAPSGYTVVGEKFHTHPNADAHGVVELHPYTVQLATELGETHLDGLSHVRLSNPSGFSGRDLDMGGGYLAAQGRLLFHKDGQTQDLGLIEKAAPVCTFSR